MGTEKRERQKSNRALKQQQLHQQAARRKTLRYVVIGVGAVVGVFLLAWIASNFVGDDDNAPVDSVVPVTMPAVDVTTSPSAPDTTTGG